MQCRRVNAVKYVLPTCQTKMRHDATYTHGELTLVLFAHLSIPSGRGESLHNSLPVEMILYIYFNVSFAWGVTVLLPPSSYLILVT